MALLKEVQTQNMESKSEILRTEAGKDRQRSRIKRLKHKVMFLKSVGSNVFGSSWKNGRR